MRTSRRGRVYLLAHVLFVADFEERERIARVCCLAWNIGLFPDARDRERHIENTLDLFFDNEEVPPPPGVRQGYGDRAVQRCWIGRVESAPPRLRCEVRRLIARGIPKLANV